MLDGDFNFLSDFEDPIEEVFCPSPPRRVSVREIRQKFETNKARTVTPISTRRCSSPTENTVSVTQIKSNFEYQQENLLFTPISRKMISNIGQNSGRMSSNGFHLTSDLDHKHSLGEETPFVDIEIEFDDFIASLSPICTEKSVTVLDIDLENDGVEEELGQACDEQLSFECAQEISINHTQFCQVLWSKWREKNPKVDSDDDESDTDVDGVNTRASQEPLNEGGAFAKDVLPKNNTVTSHNCARESTNGLTPHTPPRSASSSSSSSALGSMLGWSPKSPILGIKADFLPSPPVSEGDTASSECKEESKWHQDCNGAISGPTILDEERAKISPIQKNVSDPKESTTSILNRQSIGRKPLKIQNLQDACEAGDEKTVKLVVAMYPERTYARDRARGFQDVLYAAIRGRNPSVLQELGVTCDDVLAVDALVGDNMFHYAASHRPRLGVMKFLASTVLNSSIHEAPIKMAIRRNKKMIDPKSSLLPRWSGHQGNRGPDRAANTSDMVLKEGWLQKLNSQNVWQRRYCYLTFSEIRYAHAPLTGCRRVCDSFPLSKNSSTFQLRADLGPGSNVVSVFSSHGINSQKKFRTSLTLKADSDGEMQEWMKFLSVVAKMDNLRCNDPCTLYNNKKLRQAISKCNKRGMTPLHKVASISAESLSSKGFMDANAAATWLVDSGCPINARNNEGKTALLLAAENKNNLLVKRLLELGADAMIKDRAGGCASDIMTTSSKGRKKGLAPDESGSVGEHKLPPPTKVFGLTYLTLNLEKVLLASSSVFVADGCLENPFLSISVLNAQQQLIEPIQNIEYPHEIDVHLIRWDVTWHMQTPLERLPEGSILLIRLRAKDPNAVVQGWVRDMCWATYNVDTVAVNSGPVSLQLYDDGVDFSPSSPSFLDSNDSALEACVNLWRRIDCDVAEGATIKRQSTEFLVKYSTQAAMDFSYGDVLNCSGVQRMSICDYSFNSESKDSDNATASPNPSPGRRANDESSGLYYLSASELMIANCVHRFMSTTLFDKRIHALHSACETGDAEAVRSALVRNPDDRHVRDRGRRFRSTFHAAVCARDPLRVLDELALTASDVIACDSKNNNLFHYAASNQSNVKVLNYIADVFRFKGFCNPTRKVKLKVGQELKSGWLMKLNSHRVWQKRFVYLLNGELKYSHRPVKSSAEATAIFPVDKASTSFNLQSDLSGYIFTVFSHKRSLVSKQRNSITFKAQSESEMNAWIEVLNMTCTIEAQRNDKCAMIDSDALRAAVAHRNSFGDSPLHMAAKTMGSTSNQNPHSQVAGMEVVQWLIDNGCDLDARNRHGKTALMFAIESGNDVLARRLVIMGANCSIKDAYGKSAADLMRASVGSSKMPASRDPFLSTRFKAQPPPKKVTGLTYMSLKVDQIISDCKQSLRNLEKPFLSIQVLNSQQSLVEPVQDLLYPSSHTAESIQWQSTWHMQTPLERVPQGSTVVVRLRGKDKTSSVLGHVKDIAWATYAINHKTITSNATLLQLMQRTKIGHSQCVATSKMALECNVFIQRKVERGEVLIGHHRPRHQSGVPVPAPGGEVLTMTQNPLKAVGTGIISSSGSSSAGGRASTALPALLQVPVEVRGSAPCPSPHASKSLTGDDHGDGYGGEDEDDVDVFPRTPSVDLENPFTPAQRARSLKAWTEREGNMEVPTPEAPSSCPSTLTHGSPRASMDGQDSSMSMDSFFEGNDFWCLDSSGKLSSIRSSPEGSEDDAEGSPAKSIEFGLKAEAVVENGEFSCEEDATSVQMRTHRSDARTASQSSPSPNNNSSSSSRRGGSKRASSPSGSEDSLALSESEEAGDTTGDSHSSSSLNLNLQLNRLGAPSLKLPSRVFSADDIICSPNQNLEKFASSAFKTHETPLRPKL